MICAIQTFKVVFLPPLLVLLVAISWSSLSYLCPNSLFPLDLLCDLNEGVSLDPLTTNKDELHEDGHQKRREGGDWVVHGRNILPFYGSGGEEGGVFQTLDYRIADPSDVTYLLTAATEATARKDHLVAADLLHCTVNIVEYMKGHGLMVEGVDLKDLLSTVYYNLAMVHIHVDEEGYCLYDHGPVHQGYLYDHDPSISPAIDSLEKALSIVPSNAGWHQLLGELYSVPPLSHIGSEVDSTWNEGFANSKAVEHFVSEIRIVTGLPAFEEWGRMVGDVEPFDTLTFSSVLPFFNRLINALIKSARYGDVGTTFDLLNTLQPANAELCSRQSVWHYGKGNIRRGLLMSARDVTLQLRQSSDYDPRTGDRKAFIEPEVSARMMVQLTSNFGNVLVLMAKSLLVRGHWREAVSMLNRTCHGTAGATNLLINSPSPSGTAIKYTDLVGVLHSCLESSNLVEDLIHGDGAWQNASNAFGWQPVHHAVMIGSLHMLEALLGGGERDGADHVGAVTDSGFTPLHVAAIFPSEASGKIVSLLLNQGVNVSAVDLFGRTALALTVAVGSCIEGLNSNCSSPVPPPPPRRDTFDVIKDFDGNDFLQLGTEVKDIGGWKGKPTWISQQGKYSDESSCPIDVRVGLSYVDFTRNYLSVNRPVIIRRSNTDHDEREFQNLRLKLRRDRFMKEYGSGVMVNHGPIPNGDAFQLPHRRSSIETFVEENMGKQYPPRSKTSANDYVYQQLSPHDTLAELFFVPAVFDPDQSSLITLSSYFFLGGATSGQPVQFRRHSWNQLVYGESRWIIFPPSDAIYSTESIHSFVERGGGGHYDCRQHAGDIVFMPPRYSYGVMHTMESIGFASEFVVGEAEFSI